MSNDKQNPQNIEIFTLATDPIYIGTGGYTIGRVDNTIVRDPITNVPKIPGSSLAGTWRYYTVLEIHKYFSNEELRNDKSKRREKVEEFLSSKSKIKWEDLSDDEIEKFMKSIFTSKKNWILFEGNRYIGIKCAGQDDTSHLNFEKIGIDEEKNKTGHCGHCIVCKGFGFSKKDISWQGMIFFSDLNILFFPVFTIKGTKWITTVSRLKEIEITSESEPSQNKIKTKNGDERHLNLGWLYLEVEKKHKLEEDEKLNDLKFDSFKLKPEDIIIVPDDLFSHIVNSNLEVRTSVSIDPITGAAKEGALFTSEAIPRGTIFYGNIRIFDKSVFEEIENKLKSLPDKDMLSNALKDSKHFYETLGIGGMTTRGFGRLKIIFPERKEE
ncbi:type III-B CRISPR module RAMP protein Cmr4 [Persephonella sp.]